jgi:predicted nucleic acid-binding protein
MASNDPVPGLTLDTGALIALERRDARVARIITAAKQRGMLVTIPAAVVVEWWRGASRRRRELLQTGVIEPLLLPLAQSAGEALADAGAGPSPTDAVVMASAATRGDKVLTSDVDDLERLRSVFPGVRVLRV